MAKKGQRKRALKRPERLRLERLLTVIHDEFGRETLDQMFLHAAESRCGRGRLNEAAVLAGCIRKFNWRGKMEDDGDYIDALAECIQRMRLSLNDMVEMIPPPWNRLQSGSTVVIVVGKRTIPNPHPGEAGTLQHYAVGARDAEVAAHLTSFIQRGLQKDCRIELCPVGAGALESRGRRIEYLLDMLDKAKRGALICVGSPVVNPLTDLLAEMICHRTQARPNAEKPLRKKPPAQFVWPLDTWEKLRDCQSYLTCSQRPSEDKPLGIRLQGSDHTLPVRDSDTTIRAAIDRVAIEGRKWRGARFRDCGLLMADTRDDNRFLALCAGHGGLGTLAASHALASRALGTFLARSQQAANCAEKPLWCIGAERVMQVVNVDRKKPTGEYFDDLTFESDPWAFEDETELDEPTAWSFHLPLDDDRF